MHTPVLLDQLVDGLKIVNGGQYIDATFGAGGDSLAIVQRGGTVLGIEIDEQMYKQGLLKYANLINQQKKLRLVLGNYRNIDKIARNNQFYPVNGIVFDLGLSMDQLNQPVRGFSFKNKSDILDMRLDTNSSVTAAQLINQSSADELYSNLARFCEEPQLWIIVQAIIKQRRHKLIKTVGDLRQAIDQVITDEREKVYRRIFQGLRMMVNQELNNLKEALEKSLRLLKPEGRLAVISFHSVEDRLVKMTLKKQGARMIHKSVIRAKQPLRFERSAKLRIYQL